MNDSPRSGLRPRPGRRDPPARLWSRSPRLPVPHYSIRQNARPHTGRRRSSDKRTEAPAHLERQCGMRVAHRHRFLLKRRADTVGNDPVSGKNPRRRSRFRLWLWRLPVLPSAKMNSCSCGSPVRNRTCCWSRDRIRPGDLSPGSPIPTPGYDKPYLW